MCRFRFSFQYRQCARADCGSPLQHVPGVAAEGGFKRGRWGGNLVAGSTSATFSQPFVPTTWRAGRIPSLHAQVGAAWTQAAGPFPQLRSRGVTQLLFPVGLGSDGVSTRVETGNCPLATVLSDPRRSPAFQGRENSAPREIDHPVKTDKLLMVIARRSEDDKRQW